MWRLRRTLDIHQTVHTDGIAGKGSAEVQVGQRHTIHRILRLQVEVGMQRVASEDDGTAFQEGEVLLDDILDGDAIGAILYGIGAEHLERPLVVERRTDAATAMERDVVVGLGVHQDAERTLWRGVDIEVDIDVRGRSKVLIGVLAMTRTYAGMIHPGDKLLLADGVGVGGIVGKDRLGLGGYGTVDYDLAGTSVEVGSTRGIDRTADDAAIEIVEVVGQQVLGRDIHVEGEVREMVVVDATIQRALMSFLVGNHTFVHENTVGNQPDGVLLHRIGGVKCGHGGLSVNYHVASQVEFREGTVEHHVTIGIAADVVEERLREGLAELDAGSCCLDIQVDILTHWRDITIDKGL